MIFRLLQSLHGHKREAGSRSRENAINIKAGRTEEKSNVGALLVCSTPSPPHLFLMPLVRLLTYLSQRLEHFYSGRSLLIYPAKSSGPPSLMLPIIMVSK